MRPMCLENGSPLPLVRDLRRLKELQSLRPLPHLYDVLLLALLWCHLDLALGRGMERQPV